MPDQGGDTAGALFDEFADREVEIVDRKVETGSGRWVRRFVEECGVEFEQPRVTACTRGHDDLVRTTAGFGSIRTERDLAVAGGAAVERQSERPEQAAACVGRERPPATDPATEHLVGSELRRQRDA